MSWRSAWEGLWRRRPGIYVSRVCDKSELDRVPNKFRLIIKENRNHVNNNSKTPRFVFSFSDEEEQKSIMLKTEEPMLRESIYQLAHEYKRMESAAISYSEKEFAKKQFARKMILFVQKTSGVNLTEVLSLCKERNKKW